MISENADQILEKDSGLVEVLENDKFDELKKMFDLFKL